jgi:hypothetical protein
MTDSRPQMKPKSRRGVWRRRILAAIAAGITTLLFAWVLLWYIPSGSHVASRTLADEHSNAKLEELGTIKELPGSPEGEMQGYKSSGISVTLDQGGKVVVSAFEYKSWLQARVQSWLMSPERNTVAWEASNRRVPDEEESWELPDGSSLVGFHCTSGGCERWYLWWPRGADILLLDLREVRWSGPGAAANRLRPVWQALR